MADYIQEFVRLWTDAEKVVFSRTLATPATKRTRIARELNADAVRQRKVAASQDNQVMREVPERFISARRRRNRK